VNGPIAVQFSLLEPDGRVSRIRLSRYLSSLAFTDTLLFDTVTRVLAPDAEVEHTN
jgi:hypothetical protein